MTRMIVSAEMKQMLAKEVNIGLVSIAAKKKSEGRLSTICIAVQPTEICLYCLACLQWCKVTKYFYLSRLLR